MCQVVSSRGKQLQYCCFTGFLARAGRSHHHVIVIRPQIRLAADSPAKDRAAKTQRSCHTHYRGRKLGDCAVKLVNSANQSFLRNHRFHELSSVWRINITGQQSCQVHCNRLFSPQNIFRAQTERSFNRIVIESSAAQVRKFVV